MLTVLQTLLSSRSGDSQERIRKFSAFAVSTQSKLAFGAVERRRDTGMCDRLGGKGKVRLVTLTLSFLGQFYAASNGSALTSFESVKVRGLLAYLAIESERPHSRDALTGLLWPDWPQSSARRSLSQALFNLRQVIGDPSANPPYLLIDRLNVQWNRASAAALDFWAIEPLLRLPATKLSPEMLEVVTDCYRGKLLAGFVIDESDPFLRWLEGRREQLHRQVMLVFDERIRRLMAQGNDTLPEALQLAEQQLTFEAWREESHRHVMQLLALQGQRSAALAHFEQCKKLLADELAVEPDAQTMQLLAQIQRDEIGGLIAQRLNGNQQRQNQNQNQRLDQGDSQHTANGALDSLVQTVPLAVMPTPVMPTSVMATPNHPSSVSPFSVPPSSVLPGSAKESRPSPIISLPPVPGGFVGRASEQVEILRLLSDDACRLLTLIGPGGIGKTWLATHAVHAWLEQVDHQVTDGVYFVSLAEAEANGMGSIVEQIVQPIANALALTFSTQTSLLEQLSAYLVSKQLLLVMDNFEPLIEGAFVISELLNAAPQLRILVTSRERLNLQEEWLLELTGLDFPEDEDVSVDASWLASSVTRHSALQLFIQNARRVQPTFIVDQDAILPIVRICRLLAGMPLGIAIAASWVRHLTCSEIVTEMERDRDFLTSTQRNIPTRHRSMRAVFNYSWRLLTNEEQQSLARIAIFPQSFNRISAKAIADAGLPLLSTLVDKSLLQRLENGRYVLHPQLRQFAFEHLEQSPSALYESRQRHARWFGELLQQSLLGLSGVEQKEAVSIIVQEVDHLRLGWRFVVETGQPLLIDHYVPGLFHLYNIRGWYLEGAMLFKGAIEQMIQHPECHEIGSRSAVALAALQIHYAEFLHRLSSFDEARHYLDAAMPFVRAHQRSAEIGFALNALGYNWYMRGDYQAAQAPYQEALAIFRQTRHFAGIATVLNNLGNVFAAQDESGSYQGAQRCYEESLQVARASGNQQEIARALLNLGTIAHVHHEYLNARFYYEESIQSAREIDSRRNLAIALSNLGDVYIQTNDLTAAQSHLLEALSLKRKLGDQRSAAYTLNILSDVYLKLGDRAHAYSSCLEALRTALAVKALPVACETMLQLANLLLGVGEQKIAFKLALIILHHPAPEESAKKHAHTLLTQLPTVVNDNVANDNIVNEIVNEEEIKFLQHRAKIDDLKALLDPLIQQIPAILAVA